VEQAPSDEERATASTSSQLPPRPVQSASRTPMDRRSRPVDAHGVEVAHCAESGGRAACAFA
jgi:hypothetical protein